MNLREILQRSLRFVPRDGDEERDLREAIEDLLAEGGPRVYRAYYHTRHFDFEAFDTDKEAATNALIRGLRTHAVQYGLEPDWWMEGFGDAPTDEIFQIDKFATAVAHRDRQPLP